MDKLRVTIAQYSRWKDLEIYIDRMEAHIESDFGISVTNAKSLLETIGKEICSQKNIDLKSAPSINAVLKNAFSALGYSNTSLVNQVSSSLATIGQEIGGLRNDISMDAHGKTLEELRKRNNKVDLLTREFLIDSTMMIAVFLIRAFEERKETINLSACETVEEELLKYDESESFNRFWDDTYGEFVMADYSYFASDILFNIDYKAYETEYKAFMEAESEVEIEEE